MRQPSASTLRKPTHGGFPGRLLPRYQPIHRNAAADPRSKPPLPSRLGPRHDPTDPIGLSDYFGQ